MAFEYCRLCDMDFSSDDKEGILREIREFTENIPADLKTDPETYRERLEMCSDCANLSDITCTRCGCFVQIRAAKKHMKCPDPTKKWK